MEIAMDMSLTISWDCCVLSEELYHAVQQVPAGSAMPSTSTFYPHKLSIILLRYYVDGGPAGRGECNKWCDNTLISSSKRGHNYYRRQCRRVDPCHVREIGWMEWVIHRTATLSHSLHFSLMAAGRLLLERRWVWLWRWLFVDKQNSKQKKKRRIDSITSSWGTYSDIIMAKGN